MMMIVTVIVLMINMTYTSSIATDEQFLAGSTAKFTIRSLRHCIVFFFLRRKHDMNTAGGYGSYTKRHKCQPPLTPMILLVYDDKKWTKAIGSDAK